jgi:hypothetical protein
MVAYYRFFLVFLGCLMVWLRIFRFSSVRVCVFQVYPHWHGFLKGNEDHPETMSWIILPLWCWRMNPSHLSRLRISLCSVWKLKIEYNSWFLLFLGRHGWLRCRFCPFVTTPSGLQMSLYFVWVGVQKVGWDGICLLSCLGKRWGRNENYKVAAETKLFFFYDFLGKKINSGQTTSLLAFFFFVED